MVRKKRGHLTPNQRGGNQKASGVYVSRGWYWARRSIKGNRRSLTLIWPGKLTNNTFLCWASSRGQELQGSGFMNTGIQHHKSAWYNSSPRRCPQCNSTWTAQRHVVCLCVCGGVCINLNQFSRTWLLPCGLSLTLDCYNQFFLGLDGRTACTLT